MRTIKIFMVVATGLVVFASGCRKEKFDKLSQTDQEALAGIDAAYENAKVYNDSLIHCTGSGNPCSQEYNEYCDSMFHHYEGLWSHHHDNYSHDNAHDDHYHNEHGVRYNGIHINHDDSEGHHESHHILKKRQSDEHEPYHP